MRVIGSIFEAVGATVLMELKNFCAFYGAQGRIFGKIESFNPSGSVKDRAAREIILEAVESGALAKGGLIVEATSGNMGIALCTLGAAEGFRVCITMPENMSAERVEIMQRLNGEVVLTRAQGGMRAAIEEAERIAKERGGFFVRQFENEANARGYYKSLAPEIWYALGRGVDIFVAGVGTGGTISGVGGFLKEKNPAVRVYAVEPCGSAVLSCGKAGSHAIAGIGAGFVPALLNRSILDGVVAVSDEEAAEKTNALIRTEGIFAGISSGAALSGCLSILKQHKGANIVTVLPDSGNRYLSNK